MRAARLVSIPLLALPLLLAGCSLFPTTRKLPVPKAPSIVYTVTPERLVEQLNQRWDALETLTVKVTIQARTQKPREGLETTMPTVTRKSCCENRRCCGFTAGLRSSTFHCSIWPATARISPYSFPQKKRL